MINSEHICMSCMKEIGEAQQCPHCGYYVDTPQISPYLAVRTVVGNRYLVGKLLEYNGDGATYIAWDINEKKPVTIREFLPDALCSRQLSEKEVTVMSGCEITYSDCKADFLELWRKLTRMSGLSALVNVYEVFEENSTAYAICEYVESITLRDYLLRLKTGYIPWERARTLFMPVLSTLGMLHTAGIIHRGISPLTLNLGRDGKMRLNGFSIWQARTARGDLTAQLFPGYAAIEQYGFEGQQGPWTDLYSFAATLYRALIGSDPIEATERLTNDRLMVPGRFAEQLPAYVINGLINALQILPEDRTRSVDQLRAELSASPTATVSSSEFTGTQPAVENNRPQPAARKPQLETEPKKKPASAPAAANKMVIIKAALISGIACLLVFLIVVIAFGDKMGLSSGKEEETETVVTTGTELVNVGTFTGKSFSEVSNSAYWKSYFTFERVDAFSDTVAAGYIVSQSPEPGAKVNKGEKVVLTVSKGIEQFELPNVVGQDYDTAKAMLKEANFVVSKETEINDGSHEAGTVKSTSLTVGKSFDKGTAVTLYVWGDAPTTAAPVTTAPAVENPSGEPNSVPDTTGSPLVPATQEPVVPTQAAN